jgi:ribosomal protein L37E
MGLKIYGVAAVQSPDRVGETIIIKDINTDALRYINDEHSGDMFSMLGAITAHKKILSRNDCVSPRHIKCWDKVQKPFLYVEGELADEHDHPNAQAAAALLKFTHQHPELPLKVGFSIEGGILQRGEGKQHSTLEKTQGEGVSLTVKPCHPDVQLFLQNDLMKSLVPIDMPPKYIEALKKSGYTPSFKETKYTQLLPKLEKLKKSMEQFVDGITHISCKKCGQSTRLFKSSHEWPNACHKCGNGYKMKDIYKALKG